MLIASHNPTQTRYLDARRLRCMIRLLLPNSNLVYLLAMHIHHLYICQERLFGQE